jgi:GT2 family glycosyltransferase
MAGAWDPDRPRYVAWAHGAFLLLRRSAFDAVGGFDTSQWMYAEDIVIAWRLARSGSRVRYEPSARVLHEVSAATLRFGEADRMQREYGATYAWMARRQRLLSMRVAALFALLGHVIPFVALLSLGPGSRDRRRRVYVHRNALGLRPKTKLANPR